MPRFKLTVEYDGTGLAGWQRQDNQPSVQSLLEAAVEKFCGLAPTVIGAGRTDAGVHATAQVAHVDIDKDVTAHNVMHGLNFHLQPITSQVMVVVAEVAKDDFHARFSATGRTYFYRIINRQARLALALNRAWHVPEILDVPAMKKGAEMLTGHHDFTTFRSSECQSKSPEKTLDVLHIVGIGEEIHIYAAARSFLHHQVRNMVGTLRLIGNGKWTLKDLKTAFDAKDRSKAGETAPACGLYLTEVVY